MKRLILSLLLIAAVPAVSAQDISGSWSGEADLGAQKLLLVFNIEKTVGGYSGTMDSPNQGAVGIPVSSVVFSGGMCKIAINNLGFEYTGILRGNDNMDGSFTQFGATFTLNLQRTEKTVRNRPQEPLPPYPYISEDVEFVNHAAGIKLAGTLTMPEKGGKFPAVVMITGSGAQNRDEELFGHKPFLVIADYLTRNGIAVLRFDDRGSGASEGDFGNSTGADFAADAYAAVEYLKTRSETDPGKIGLAGHSEGGSIAFAVAAQYPRDIAFVVSLAGAGVPGDSITLMQMEDLSIQRNLPRQAIDMQMTAQRRTMEILKNNPLDYILANIDGIMEQLAPGIGMMPEDTKTVLRKAIESSVTPWSFYFFSHDPAKDIRRVECPVFAANGLLDIQVRAEENLGTIVAALDEGGNTSYAVKKYPGLNHMFQHAETGALSEYANIEETFAPEVLEDIVRWIKEVTRTK